MDRSHGWLSIGDAFPEPKGRWMVSNGGGLQPVWRADGSELFYVSGGGLTSVTISTDDGFAFGPPKELFSVNMKEAWRRLTLSVTTGNVS
jgi:hypothetical protein